MDTLWPLMILVLFANLIEAIAGFGSTVLSLTLGAQLFSIEDLLAMLVPLNLLLSIGILIRSGHQIHWKIFLYRILPIAGAGLPIGIFLFQRYSGTTLIQTAFGLVVVLLSTFELAKMAWEKRYGPIQVAQDSLLPSRISLIFLFLGGIMQGMYASGGPFIVYYASRALPEKGSFRATLSLLWLLMNLVLVATLSESGKVSAYTLQFSFYLVPAVLAGLFAGSKIHDHVSEYAFRAGVYVLLAVAGFALLLR